jgi:hypothetical protein
MAPASYLLENRAKGGGGEWGLEKSRPGLDKLRIFSASLNMNFLSRMSGSFSVLRRMQPNNRKKLMTSNENSVVW